MQFRNRRGFRYRRTDNVPAPHAHALLDFTLVAHGVDRAGHGADYHRIEAADLAQLLLPGHHVLQFALAAEVQAEHHIFGDHDEQRQVDGVDALAQDGPLPAALAEPGLVPLRAFA